MSKSPILIIDDDSDVLTSIGTALELSGYEVLTAPNGQAGLDLAVERGVCLILLDIGMPVMDGHAFMSEYRNASSLQAPIVVLTGRPGEDGPASGESVSAWLSKPLDIDALLDVVERHASAPGDACDPEVLPGESAKRELEADLLGSISSKRDPDSLAALYDAYAAAAFGMCMRLLGDRMLAEDALQDAFMNIWRKADSFDRSKATARSWILAVVHHQAIDHLRRQRGPTLPPVLGSLQQEAMQPDVWIDVERNLDRDRILRALAALPPAQSVVVQLAYFGGLTHAEIAKLLAIPLGTVKGRLRLALDKLRDSLAENAPKTPPEPALAPN